MACSKALECLVILNQNQCPYARLSESNPQIDSGNIEISTCVVIVVHKDTKTITGANNGYLGCRHPGRQIRVDP